MAFSFTGSATNGGLTGSGTITHGLTINQGDLVAMYVHTASATIPVSIANGGAPWTRAQFTNRTSGHTLWWKIAGPKEPATYDLITPGGPDWRICVQVFSTPDNYAEVDQAVIEDLFASADTGIVIQAADGAIIADDAVAIVAGGKNSGGTAEAYTTADSSFTGVAGNVGDKRTAVAHRIFTTGATLAADVIIDTGDGNDGASANSYGYCMSFVEATRPSQSTPLPLQAVNSYTNANNTSHTVDLPPGLTEGNGLVILGAADGSPTFTLPGGWTELADAANGSNSSCVIGYRIIDGTEGASITVTTSNTQEAVFRVIEYSNVNFTTDPPEVSTVATGTSTAPNPGSVAHSNGNANYQYLAMAAVDGPSRITAAPTSYEREDSASTNGATTAIGLIWASRDIAASTSDDPAAFTVAASEQWISFNIAIPFVAPPGGAGGALEIAQAFGII
jgi:hypothetical protein